MKNRISATVIVGLVLILSTSFISVSAITENNQGSQMDNMEQDSAQTSEGQEVQTNTTTEIQMNTTSNESNISIRQKSTQTNTQHTSVSSEIENKNQRTKQVAQSEATVINQQDNDKVRIHITGNLEPGGLVTITATQNGSPISSAEVIVNNKRVEITNEDGKANITVPNKGEFLLKIVGGNSNTEFKITVSHN